MFFSDTLYTRCTFILYLFKCVTDNGEGTKTVKGVDPQSRNDRRIFFAISRVFLQLLAKRFCPKKKNENVKQIRSTLTRSDRRERNQKQIKSLDRSFWASSANFRRASFKIESSPSSELKTFSKIRLTFRKSNGFSSTAKRWR